MTLILHIYQVIVAQDYLKESADTVKRACYQESENVIFFIYVFSTCIILSLLNHKQWFMFMDNTAASQGEIDCTLWKSKAFDLFLTISNHLLTAINVKCLFITFRISFVWNPTKLICSPFESYSSESVTASASSRSSDVFSNWSVCWCLRNLSI